MMRAVVTLVLVAACTRTQPTPAQACHGGDLAACYDLAVELERVHDPAAARVFYEKACAGNHREACTNLGALFGRGDGVARDDAAAAQLYRKACDAELMTPSREERFARITADVDRALAADATQPLAATFAQELDPARIDAARARAVAVAVAHPEDVLALALLARTLDDGPERAAAVARLCAALDVPIVLRRTGARCPE